MEFELRGDDIAAAAFLERVRELGPSCIEAVDVVARDGATFMRRAAITALLEWDVARGQARALEALVPDAHDYMKTFSLNVLADATTRESLDAIVDALGTKDWLNERVCGALAQRVARDLSLVPYLVARARALRGSGLTSAIRAAHDALLRVGAPHCDDAYDAYVAEIVGAGEVFARDIVEALAMGTGPARERTLLRIEACVDERCAAEARLARVRREIGRGTPEDAAARLESLAAHEHDIRAAHEAVARVFAGSPLLAYATLAPLLDAVASSTPVEHVWVDPRFIVANAVLEELHRAHLDGRDVDARFLEHARPLAVEEHSLATQAEDTVAAFAWIADGRRLPWIFEVSLPGDEGLPLAAPMPLLLAGIEIDRNDAAAMARVRELFARTDAPPGLAAYRHQFRGLTCDQFELVGYAVAPPAELSAALEVFDDDGSVEWGAPYPAETLARGRAGIERIFHFGPIAAAFEALLLAAPCAPARTVAGCDVLRFVDQPSWREALPRPWMRSVLVNSGDVPQLLGTYGEAHDRALAAVAHAVNARLCVAIVWGNSD